MSKVFVTGGAGFLGTHLLRALKTFNGIKICAPTSQECNLFESNSLTEYNDKYDLIIHLAAWTQAGDFCLRYPGDQWLNNQRINTNLLEWWSSQQRQAKLVFIGTSCSYPEESDHIEENYLRGEPTESLLTYAMTKRMLLVGAQSLSKQYGLDFCSFVPSTLYGPGYHTDGRQMHFIFDLVRKICDAADGGPVPVLWGDGNQIRELIHVDDFIEVMLKLIPKISNEILNIGGYSQGTIRGFAEVVSSCCGYDSSLIIYDASKYVGSKKKVLNNTRLQQLMPALKTRSIENGIQSLVDWYKLNKRFFKDGTSF